ncbi:hypothetical protein [Janthinobacterium sp. HLX7-2]|uniref:hypothetical protein n=1 Tax=Janthinobacterium sp. HLX7-2 TaxID=1259331 RepID=UPI003F523E76
MIDYKPKLQGLASIIVGKAAWRCRFTPQSAQKSIKSCARRTRIGQTPPLCPSWRTRHTKSILAMASDTLLIQIESQPGHTGAAGQFLSEDVKYRF